LPGFLGDVLVDALPELAGIGSVIEAFGFDAEQHALDGSGHGRIQSLRATMRKRAVAVATRTPSASRSSPAVSALRSSRVTSLLVAVKVPSFAGFRNDTFRFAVSAVDSAGSTAYSASAVDESSIAHNKPPCTVPCRFRNSGSAR